MTKTEINDFIERMDEFGDKGWTEKSVEEAYGDKTFEEAYADRKACIDMMNGIMATTFLR